MSTSSKIGYCCRYHCTFGNPAKSTGSGEYADRLRASIFITSARVRGSRQAERGPGGRGADNRREQRRAAGTAVGRHPIAKFRGWPVEAAALQARLVEAVTGRGEPLPQRRLDVALEPHATPLVHALHRPGQRLAPGQALRQLLPRLWLSRP